MELLDPDTTAASCPGALLGSVRRVCTRSCGRGRAGRDRRAALERRRAPATASACGPRHAIIRPRPEEDNTAKGKCEERH